MGKRGPAPTPTRLKELRGNPGKRKLNAAEPKPPAPPRPPRVPADLVGTVARKEWTRMARELHKLGLLTEVDLAALRAYCQCYGRWVEAEAVVDREGEVVLTTNGNVIQNPYLAIANRAQSEMRRWIKEFGMTPSSRTGLEVPSEEDLDAATAFFKGVAGRRNGGS